MTDNTETPPAGGDSPALPVTEAGRALHDRLHSSFGSVHRNGCWLVTLILAIEAEAAQARDGELVEALTRMVDIADAADGWWMPEQEAAITEARALIESDDDLTPEEREQTRLQEMAERQAGVDW